MWIWIAFWTFVTLVSVAGILTAFETRKAKLDLIRLAIEKGQTLEPALIDKLMPAEEEKETPSRAQAGAGLQVGGIMCFAAGIGLPVLGYFISSIESDAFPALLGVGGFLLCMGVGMFVASKFVQSKATARSE